MTEHTPLPTADNQPTELKAVGELRKRSELSETVELSELRDQLVAVGVERDERNAGIIAAELEAEPSPELSRLRAKEALKVSERVALDRESPPMAYDTITVTSEAPLVDKFNLSAGKQVKQVAGIPEAPPELEPAPVTVANTAELVRKLARQGARPASRPMPSAPITVSAPATAAANRRKAIDWPPWQDQQETEQTEELRFDRVSPFVDPRVDPLSTFGLDVDTASYTQVRRYLKEGTMPPANLVRPEEMLNFFDYRESPPRRGDFALTADGALHPFADDPSIAWLRFSIRAREVDTSDRPPAVLTFVVDRSGSMRQQNRLEMVKRSLELLLDQLRPDDQVGLVTYNTQGEILLRPTRDKEAIRRALQRLHPGGSTNLQSGMSLGYQLAASSFVEGGINRVIICSDGVANVGETEAMQLLAEVADWASRGIELTTVGVGMGDYNDELLERLANRGDGSYAYVDTLKEARRVFVENLTGTLLTVAYDARAQVRFNPEMVESYRRIGYENRALPDQAFRAPNVDAGEIGSGHRVTVMYEVKVREDGSASNDSLAELTLRYRSKASGEMVERSSKIRGDDITRWRRTTPAFRMATVVATFGEHLRGSPWARGDLEQLFSEAQRLGPHFAGSREVAELVSLIGEAWELREAQR